MNIFNSVKKAEIHVHLEATITPDLCKKFAKRNNYEIAEEMFGSKSPWVQRFCVTLDQQMPLNFPWDKTAMFICM